MPQCLTGHIRTSYKDIGKKTAPALLLLHGWGQSWETWAAYIPQLSQSYRLIIPDLPGFGQSDGARNGWNMESYTIWLATFLEECQITEIHAVIGHSFGGKLASFAWLNPHNEFSLPTPKQGVFLISASGIVPPKSFWQARITPLFAALPQELKRSIFAPLRSFLYKKILRETDYLLATPFQEATLREILSEDIRDFVKKPQPLPLRIAWGTQDTYVPLWMAYEFAQLSTDSSVFALPEAGHFAHLTHIVPISNWLETWL